MEFSAAALWQAPCGKEMEVMRNRAFATVPPQKTFQRGALAPAGIGSASSAFARRKSAFKTGVTPPTALSGSNLSSLRLCRRYLT